MLNYLPFFFDVTVNVKIGNILKSTSSTSISDKSWTVVIPQSEGTKGVQSRRPTFFRGPQEKIGK